MHANIHACICTFDACLYAYVIMHPCIKTWICKPFFVNQEVHAGMRVCRSGHALAQTPRNRTRKLQLVPGIQAHARMCTWMQKYLREYTYTVHTPADIYANMQTYRLHTSIHYMQQCMSTYMPARMHTCKHIYIYIYTYIYIHT